MVSVARNEVSVQSDIFILDFIRKYFYGLVHVGRDLRSFPNDSRSCFTYEVDNTYFQDSLLPGFFNTLAYDLHAGCHFSKG